MRERSRSSSPVRGRKRSRSRSGSPARRGGFPPAPADPLAAAVNISSGLSGLPAIALPGAEPFSLPGPPGGGGGALALASAASGGVPGMTPAQQAALRKAKEVYIGNLAVGQTTMEVLRELFNKALIGFLDNPMKQEAVCDVKMDPTAGRFAFVELLTEELASAALTLDRTEVFGKPMKIARPAGYIGPQVSAQALATDKIAYAQQLAAKLAAGGKSHVLRLDGLVDVATLRNDDSERQELLEMVYEEAVRCGKVRGVLVPLPPLDLADASPSRVYIRFELASEATKCKEMMDGREFDDRKITADFVTDVEYNRASQGEWFTGSITDAPMLPVASVAPSYDREGGMSSHRPTPVAIVPGGSLTGLPTIQL